MNEGDHGAFTMPFSFILKAEEVNTRIPRPTVTSTYHQYGVHVTQLLLNSSTLSSSLYLFLCRLLNRQYEDAFRVADSCASEAPYSKEEAWLVNQITQVQKMDSHPDAVACRLKLAAVGALYSGKEKELWDIYSDAVTYSQCLDRVSKSCQLPRDHEYAVIQKALSRLAKKHASYRCTKTEPDCHPREFDQWILLSRMLYLDPNYEIPSIDPWHGGGGWRRIEQGLSEAIEEYDEMLPDESPWCITLPVPKYSVGTVLTGDDVEGLVSDYSHIIVHFLQLYDLVCGQITCKLSSDGDNVGYTLAAILIRMYYLMDQKFQNFPQFSYQSYRYIASALYLKDLPCGPHHGTPFKSIELPQFATGIGGKFVKELTKKVFAMTTESQWKKDYCPFKLFEDVSTYIKAKDAFEHKVLDTSCNERILDPVLLDGFELLSAEQLGVFADQPLGGLDVLGYLEYLSPKDSMEPAFPFDLSQDPVSRTKLAQDLLERQRHDFGIHVASERSRKKIVLRNLPLDKLIQFVAGKSESWPSELSLDKASEDMNKLQKILLSAYEREQEKLEKQTRVLLETASKYSLVEGCDDKENEKLLFFLRQESGRIPRMRIENVLVSMVSKHAESDLIALNPFLKEPELFIKGGAIFALHANRLSQIVRTLALCSEVCVLLDHLSGLVKTGSLDHKEMADSVEALDRAVRPFLDNLTARRSYLDSTGKDNSYSFDPRFLLFEFLCGFVLKRRQVELVRDFMQAVRNGDSAVHQMIMGEGKTTVITPLLFLMLADSNRLVTEVMPQSLVPMAVNIARNIFSSLLPRPVFCLEFSRYTVYGKPEQCLAEAKQIADRLSQMRRQHGVVVSSASSIKSVFLKYLELLRDPNPELNAAADELGVVMSLWREGILLLDEIDLLLSPLKSELNFPIGVKNPIDLSNDRWDLPIALIDAFLCPVEDYEYLSDQEREILERIKQLMEDGVQDKVFQMTPHFFINEKSLFRSFSSLLVQLASKWLEKQVNILGARHSHLEDGLFKASSDTCKKEDQYGANFVLQDRPIDDEFSPESFWCSSDFPSACTFDIAVDSSCPAVSGIDITYKHLSEFIVFSGLPMVPDSLEIEVARRKNGKFKKIIICVHCVDGPLIFPKPVSDVSKIRLRMEGIARWFAIKRIRVLKEEPRPNSSLQELQTFLSTPIGKETVETVNILSSFPQRSQQIMNLCRDLVWSYLPHSFFKVNRVHYGLLQPMDEHFLGSFDSQPLTRRLLAVPFVGKDSPSPASEFSHPDIAIALTYLAYRHEGLRLQDLAIVIDSLKLELKTEPGPVQLRPSFLLFNEWVRRAQKRLGKGTIINVLPLDLLDPRDDAQMREIGVWMCKSPEVCRYHVTTYVFPKTMLPRRLKLSCSGQTLGNTMLFGCRLGFSGTPSNLLPFELGECKYEEGSEGKIVATLTSPDCVTTEIVHNWSVEGLLTKVARAKKPGFHALIDTGALITGLSNRQVAQFLLENGLVGMTACVYIDEATRTPMVLHRDSDTDLPINKCSINDSLRFTFYDHVSTTGVDIRQCLRARAAVTLSKDMTLRDFAQGAWRMRGLGRGQTLHVYVISNLLGRINSMNLNTDSMNVKIVAWLTSNTISSEHIQFVQLSTQNLGTVWRVRAFEYLLKRSLDKVGVNHAIENLVKKNDSWYHRCIKLFEQEMDYSVAAGLPQSKKKEHDLHSVVEEYNDFITTDSQKDAISKVEKMVKMTQSGQKEAENPQEKSSLICSVASLLCGRVFCMRAPIEEIDLRVAEAVELDCEVVQEKEREQEQEQEYDKDMVSRSVVGKPVEPISWQVSSITRQRKAEDPFYPMSLFKTQNWNKVFDISLNNLDLSENHTSQEYSLDITRRLYNIYVAVEVFFDSKSRVIVVNLAEAETLRRIISRKLPPFDSTEPPRIRLIRVKDGAIIVQSSSLRDQDLVLSGPTRDALALLRFFNCDLWLSEAEISSLKMALKKVLITDRLRFFRSVLLGRRRDNNNWISTPMESILGEK